MHLSVSTLFPYTTLFRSNTVSAVTFSVSAARASNGTVNGEYSVAGLPAGATYSLSTSTFTSTGNDPIPGTTVTVNTDRKSTRLNSSHGYISYAVFGLKKK